MQFFLAVFAIFIVIVGLLWILVPAMYGLPPVSANRKRVCKALELANLQPGEIFYDLGSGHGGVLVIAAKEFGANAVGVEVGPVQCIIARINAICNGVSSKVQIEAGNFLKTDVSKADVVYAYLTSNQAKRLQEKLERELHKGARVVTVSFDFPDWKPAYFDRENLIYRYEK